MKKIHIKTYTEFKNTILREGYFSKDEIEKVLTCYNKEDEYDHLKIKISCNECSTKFLSITQEQLETIKSILTDNFIKESKDSKHSDLAYIDKYIFDDRDELKKTKLYQKY